MDATMTLGSGGINEGSSLLERSYPERTVWQRCRDMLKGGSAGAFLTGGFGKDEMTRKGGDDTFTFVKTAESASGTGTARDVIFNFQIGADTIRLPSVDADNDTADINDEFVFITQAFSGTAGELRFSGNKNNGTTVISADVDL